MCSGKNHTISGRNKADGENSKVDVRLKVD